MQQIFKFKYFIFFAIFFLLTIIFAPPREKTITNYRLSGPGGIGELQHIGVEIYNSAQSDGPLKWTSNHDDLGIYFLMASCIHIKKQDGRMNLFMFETMECFKRRNSVILFFFMLLVWLALTRLTSLKFGTIFLSIISLTPQFRAIAFGTDVYIFSVYGLGLLWLVMRELRNDQKYSWHKLIAICLCLAFCILFRKTVNHYLLGLFLFLGLLFYKKISLKKPLLKIVMVFVFVNSLIQLPKLLTDKASHITWHALHAGLFEYGGYIDKNQVPYPSFFSDELEGKKEYRKVFRWSDQIEYRYVRANFPGVEMLSKEYEQALKNHFFKLILDKPLGFIKLILSRVWNMLNFNPAMEFTHDSYILKTVWDNVFTVFGLFIILFGWYCSKSDEFWMYMFSGLVVYLPSVAVHSGYVMYNYPGIFILTLSFAYATNVLIKKYYLGRVKIN